MQKGPVISVQPFGLHSAGGGSRILRALLENAPLPWITINSNPQEEKKAGFGSEIYLPLRPYFGRIEQTRFSRLVSVASLLLGRKWERQLETVIRREKAVAVHAIAHSIDYFYCFRTAARLNLPYFLSVHDDIAYNPEQRWEQSAAADRMKEVWQGARHRFVISVPMGREYCRRYGSQPWQQVTDGLVTVPDHPDPRSDHRLNVYFMGALHRSYHANFEALYQALEQLQQIRPDLRIRLICRGSTFPGVTRTVAVIQRPWAAEREVEQDMKEADLLYMPLPFQAKYEKFVQYSLSTKMITYLGSGLPILYHGPRMGAAAELLAGKNAAIVADSLEPARLTAILDQSYRDRLTICCNALQLGREQFLLTEQRSRFWDRYQEECG